MRIIITEDSVTRRFAQNELNLLKTGKKNNRPIILEFEPEILELVDKFGNSGQSGGSAPYVAAALGDTIKSLCLQKPIAPIEDSDWGSEDSLIKGVQQNTRCYGLFKEKGKSYYLDAVVFKDENGNAWNGSAKLKSGKTIQSRQYINGFPFVPKTFIVDVEKKSTGKDDSDFIVKDESQLGEVFKYYKKEQVK